MTKRWYQRLPNFLFLIPNYFKDYIILGLEISSLLMKQVYPKKKKGHDLLLDVIFFLNLQAKNLNHDSKYS